MHELSIQNLAYLLITISCEDFLIKKRKEEKKIGGGGGGEGTKERKHRAYVYHDNSALLSQ